MQALTTTIPFQIVIVLAGFHLSIFIPLVRTTPTYEHLPASRSLNELDGSHNAWRRIILGNRQ
jgi:hypothetical protein